MARILAVMPGSSARGVALAVVLSATVAGCSSSDGEKPRALPTIPTATPSSTSPTPLASATADTSAASVVAFIKSYYAEINRAIETGDVTALSAFSTPACSCRQLLQSIKRKSTGSKIEGGRFALHEVVPHDVTPTLAAARASYDVGKAEVVKQDGSVIQTIEAETGAQDDISIVRAKGRWLVSNVFLLN